jgi:cold shock CspA family protein
MMYGIVSEFDTFRGLGTVRGEDGTEYLLHCTQIADGSRDIPEGAEVTFERMLKFGKYEATNVRPR